MIYTVLFAEDVNDDRYIDEKKEAVLASLAAADLNAWPLLDRGTFRHFAGEVTLRLILQRFKRHQHT